MSAQLRHSRPAAAGRLQLNRRWEHNGQGRVRQVGEQVDAPAGGDLDPRTRTKVIAEPEPPS